jgi:hypothetical protein
MTARNDIDMASNGKKENILTSWKEIAAYLDRDVRTCVRWEQRYGLPVHRLERDSKAKVFAYKDQIDAWLAERSSVGPLHPERKGLARLLGRPFPVIFALAGLAAAAYFLFLRSVPMNFHIRGSVLTIVDQYGRELWPFDTGLSDLENEDVYRPRFKPKSLGADYVPIWPYIMIRDINGDGRPEVLFSTQTVSQVREGTLFCFDDHGHELWRFVTGRELEFGGQPFRAEYRIFGFNVDDYDGDGTLEILVLSHQKPDWPCQTVLLDPAGKLEGEYWNAGYFMDGQAGDVDGDGQKELVLSGVNNEYRSGCVAVFEASRLWGHSPQKDEAYQSPSLSEGQQSAYILFPNSDVDAAIQQAGDPVNSFWIHEGDGLTAESCETQVIYDLDRSLFCRSVTLSNTFQNFHDRFTREGKIHSVINAAYKRALADSILYHESGKWVSRGGTDGLATVGRDRHIKKK